jgi:hypothetical protein
MWQGGDRVLVQMYGPQMIRPPSLVVCNSSPSVHRPPYLTPYLALLRSLTRHIGCFNKFLRYPITLWNLCDPLFDTCDLHGIASEILKGVFWAILSGIRVDGALVPTPQSSG